MSLARAEHVELDPTPVGGLRFVAHGRVVEACAELRGRRYLVAMANAVAVPSGRLRHAIDDALEAALALRGALPPGVEVDASVEETVRDQLFRARTLGVAGIAIAFPLLPGARTDVLDPDDSALLATWLAAAHRAPVVLLADERDRDIRVLVPARLADLGGPALPPVSAPKNDNEVPPSGEITKSAMREPEPSEPPPVLAPAPIVIEAAPTKTVDEDPATQRFPRPPPPVIAIPRRGLMKRRARVEPVEEIEAAPPPAPPACEATVEPPAVEVDVEVDVEVHVEEHAAPPVEASTRRIVNASELRAHAVELDRARGPKPVGVIEKLFATRYVPLLGAASRGDVDGAVRTVVDTWRTSFEHSYREAFSALRVTGKRPAMVFDAPDIAAKIGRLNGARAVKLLLVDAMRFDIGERVAALLGDVLAGRAVCVERAVLWSAIPTTTPTQMTLLARGAEGLRDAEPSSDPEAGIARGRAVGTIRRERVGAREVMKLDLVEARIRATGPAYEDRVDAIADEVSQIVARFVETLPPRTLLFVFGDHGFRMPVSADGRSTGAATQGGLSPEEVLVPAHAWLVGGVH